MVGSEGGAVTIPMRMISGPDCPRCGCNGAGLVEAGNTPRPWARFQCDECGHGFAIGMAPTATVKKRVTYNAVRCRCPACDAPNPPVHTTAGRVRYHKCTCGATFKSVEGE